MEKEEGKKRVEEKEERKGGNDIKIREVGERKK